uniref:Glycosyltransferase n=1 Tax=viral metagenome TaxID=1070528 RepID=A0A6M3IES5_9ZZZZ
MSIVLCDPVLQFHRKHIPHLMEWYAANKEKHQLVLHMEFGRPLQKVQGNAVRVAHEMKASHILFTEHDHWGYPIDGLDRLLHHDRDVIGLKTYQRAYPFLPMCWKKIKPELSFLQKERNLRAFHPTQPVEETDLITWAFTLVKTSVFERFQSKGQNPWIWDDFPTDSHFCECCETLGIPRYVCSEGIVCHGDVAPEHLVYWRRMFETIQAASKTSPGIAMPPGDEDHNDGVFYRTEAQVALDAVRVHQQQVMVA